MTSELHDSYFRLMTITHAIWAIEWALNYYITQLSSSSSCSFSRVGVGGRRGVVGKATPGQRGPREPWLNWALEKMLIRCSKESQYPAEWTPGPPVEHQENEKDTTLTAIKVGVKMLQFLFGLQLPLTRKPWITFSNPYNKVRGTYFSKEVFLCLYYCVVMLRHMTI